MDLHCPSCDGTNLISRVRAFSGKGKFLVSTCRDCGRRWKDAHKRERKNRRIRKRHRPIKPVVREMRSVISGPKEGWKKAIANSRSYDRFMSSGKDPDAFPYGAFKGKRFKDVPTRYLETVQQADNCDPWLRRGIEVELRRRKKLPADKQTIHGGIEVDPDVATIAKKNKRY